MLLRFMLIAAVSLWATGAVAQAFGVETFVQRVLATPDRSGLRSVVEENVDVAYLMEVSLGDNAKQMTPEQLRRFAVAFRGLIADQLSAVAEQGRSGRFSVQRQTSAAAGTVVVGAFRVGGRSQSVEFLVRKGASGDPRIADLRIGGAWASEGLSEAVGQMFEATGGDVEAVLAAMVQ